jgi:hypothetical protein
MELSLGLFAGLLFVGLLLLDVCRSYEASPTTPKCLCSDLERGKTARWFGKIRSSVLSSILRPTKISTLGPPATGLIGPCKDGGRTVTDEHRKRTGDRRPRYATRRA